MHEERVERERQMALDQRRGLTPTSMAGPHPMLPTSTHEEHHPPTSPVLNLSKGAASDGAQEEREEEREQDLVSHDSGRDLQDEERRHTQGDDDRFSDMDEDEEKEEGKFLLHCTTWSRAVSNII